MSQLEMFEAHVAPKKGTIPTADTVRPKVDAVLDQIRTGRAGGWSEAERRRWHVVFPQMCEWLPEGEREMKRAEFQRLTASHRL